MQCEMNIQLYKQGVMLQHHISVKLVRTAHFYAEPTNSDEFMGWETFEPLDNSSYLFIEWSAKYVNSCLSGTKSTTAL